MIVTNSHLRILVTGGAGFIGSHLVDRLLKLGHSVQVIDNLSGGRTEFLSHHFSDPAFAFDHLDLRDTTKLSETINPETDLVFHLAANSDISRGIEDPKIDFEQTIVATFSLLSAMRELKLGKLFYTSGSGVYGDRGLAYSSESHGPLTPVSMYGASKLAAEGLISAFCSFYSMQAWIVRPGEYYRATHDAWCYL